MTDEAPPSSGDGGPGSARRRRPAPTIDLKATEVATEPPAPEAAAEPSAPEPEVPPVEAAVPQDPVPPPEETAQEPPQESPQEPVAEEPSEAVPPPPPDNRWRPLAAGAAGGAGAALVVALLLWLALPGRDAGPPAESQAVAGLDGRLATLETRLQELAARPAPEVSQSADPKALAALVSRLDKLEAADPAKPASAAPDPALIERLGSAEARLKEVSQQLAAIGKRADTSAAALGELQDAARGTPADEARLGALDERLAGLEQRQKAAADELAKQLGEQLGTQLGTQLGQQLEQRAEAGARAVRRAVAATALRSAAERHVPFEGELAALAPLTDDKAALLPLEPFARSGVPSAAALGHELSRLVAPMLKAAGGTPREGGFLERLQANAERLVRVRPVDEAPGDDPAAVLSRVDARAAQADIPAALDELNRLPDHARAPAKDWIARAQARGRALDAARQIAADALAALKP